MSDEPEPIRTRTISDWSAEGDDDDDDEKSAVEELKNALSPRKGVAVSSK